MDVSTPQRSDDTTPNFIRWPRSTAGVYTLVGRLYPHPRAERAATAAVRSWLGVVPRVLVGGLAGHEAAAGTTFKVVEQSRELEKTSE